MSDKQKQKILDVMHTLSCIRDGRAHDAKSSAKACHNVLQEVLDIESVVVKGE
jgi:hypothetical protein